MEGALELKMVRTTDWSEEVSSGSWLSEATRTAAGALDSCAICVRLPETEGPVSLGDTKALC